MQFKYSASPREYARSFVDFSAFENRDLTLDKDNLLAKRLERMISGHVFRCDWLSITEEGKMSLIIRLSVENNQLLSSNILLSSKIH